MAVPTPDADGRVASGVGGHDEEESGAYLRGLASLGGELLAGGFA